MVLYNFLLLFFIKKQSVVLPSWTQVFGKINVLPVSAEMTWTQRMVALENHGAAVWGLSFFFLSARPQK